MIFPNLTITQNILFIIAVLSMILLITYLVTTLVNEKRQSIAEICDDIDSEAESYEGVWGFIINAFKIKGSIFFLTATSCLAFLLCIYLPIWLAILLGVVFGLIVAIAIAFIDRKPLGEIGELATVSVAIPEKGQGTGKVILNENNFEVDAESLGKVIKKGKKVIVKQNLGNKVFVERKNTFK